MSPAPEACPQDGELLCHCRGLTWGLVRGALAAGARGLGEVRAHCAGRELPESQHTRPGGECCTALLAEVLRRGRQGLDNPPPE